MPQIEMTHSGMIKTIIRNWLEEGLITSDQEHRARRILGRYTMGALAGVLLESHTARFENMLHYEADSPLNRRN